MSQLVVDEIILNEIAYDTLIMEQIYKILPTIKEYYKKKLKHYKKKLIRKYQKHETKLKINRYKKKVSSSHRAIS